MKRIAAPAAAIAALALLTYFQFPGHTWLAQDSQIYAAILERQYHPAALANDPLVQQPHVAFTIYDEVAQAIRHLTGLSFERILTVQEIAARGLGIWGVALIAGPLPAAIFALGAAVAGPAVFTLEYEPTPRAIALPLLLLAIGLVTRRRWAWAGLAAGVAVLYHPPTCWPVLLVFIPLAWRRREWRALTILAAAAALLLTMGFLQGGQSLSGTVPAWLEQLQRMRAAYNWVSAWSSGYFWHWLTVFALALAAFYRIRRELSRDRAAFLVALPVIGMLTMPASWLLLEHFKLALLPQLQPMRALLFTLLAMQLLASLAAVRALSKHRWPEAALWLFVAYLPPLESQFPAAVSLRRLLLAAALGALTAALWRLSPKLAPAAAVVAMFLIPAIGRVVNYTPLEAAGIQAVAGWARQATTADAVFLFPDAGHSMLPGVFRVEALRPVYVDWKSGGQINFYPSFAQIWWTRWRQAMQGFGVEDIPRYRALGIRYIVLRRPAPSSAPVFQTRGWSVYDLGQ